MGRPESLHARFAQAGFTGHSAHTPRPTVRSPGARQTQGPSDSPGRKPWLASPPRGVLETLKALGRPALPPTSNGQKTHRLLLGDRVVGESLSQPQDDPSPENITLAAGLGLHDTFELPLLTGSHLHRYSCWHDRLPKTTPIYNCIYGTSHELHDDLVYPSSFSAQLPSYAPRPALTFVTPLTFLPVLLNQT